MISLRFYCVENPNPLLNFYSFMCSNFQLPKNRFLGNEIFYILRCLYVFRHSSRSENNKKKLLFCTTKVFVVPNDHIFNILL